MNTDNERLRQQFQDELVEDIAKLEEELFILKECLFCYVWEEDALIEQFAQSNVAENIEVIVERVEEIWQKFE